MKIGLSLAAVMAANVLALTAHAQVLSWITPAGATVGGNAVSARADFLEGAGTVTITLTNLQKDPTADTQLISGISFNLGVAGGSGAISGVNHGSISTIGSKGSYSVGTSDPLTRWKASESGAKIDLNVFSGGQPDRQIIGPDNHGAFNPAAGSYGSANPSILNHAPVVLGSGVFTLNISAISAKTTISNVLFQFGTDSTTGFIAATVNPQESVTPEPGSVALLAALTVTAAAVGLSRRRCKKQLSGRPG